MTSPPLRIALVCTDWALDGSGGATFEDEVLRAVLALDSPHHFVVYPECARTRAAARDALAEARVTFVPSLRAPTIPSRLRDRAGRLFGARAPFRPFAALGDALSAAGAQCAWMLGGSLVPVDLPYVATVWDLKYRTWPWMPEVSVGGEWHERERLTSEFVRRAAAVMVGTEAGANEVRAAFGDLADSVRVQAMPTPAFALSAASAPLPPHPVGIPSPFLLYPAHFWPHKNHVTAVRTLAALGAADSTALVLTGTDRGTRAHVMRIAEQVGVAARVHALGFVDRDVLVALYRHAEALIHPSLFGPDNLPPLEAMALGCPVIAARAVGADTHFGDAAVLVDGVDASAFATAILRLRSDSKGRAELVSRGRERAERHTATGYATSVLRFIDTRIAPVRALWA